MSRIPGLVWNSGTAVQATGRVSGVSRVWRIESNPCPAFVRKCQGVPLGVSSTPTLEQPLRYDKPEDAHNARRRHVLYICATAAVTLVVASALAEVLIAVPFYGVTTEQAKASSAGTELQVDYPRVIRGQLDSALHLTVHP